MRTIQLGLRLMVCVGLLTVLPQAQAQSAYTMQDLGSVGSNAFIVTGLNNNGEVVGDYPTTTYTHSFVYSQGQWQEISGAGGTLLGGTGGINDSGQIASSGHIGPPTFPLSPYYRPVLYDSRTGTVENLTDPPGYGGRARAVNNQGQVTGELQVGPNYDNTHAFLYQNGQAQDLGTAGGISSSASALNSRGDVAGIIQMDSQNSHAFLCSNGVMQNIGTLPGGYVSEATGVNDSDQVVGYSNGYVNGQFIAHGFLYQNGTMKDIGTLGGEYSGAYAINNAGVIVGSAEISMANHDSVPFIYKNGVMQNLFDLIPNGDEWYLGQAEAINDKGQIAGQAYHNGVLVGFLATPVATTPAPGALWLAGIGGTWLTWRLRRRGKNNLPVVTLSGA